MGTERVIGEARDYDELLDAFKRRCHELGTSMEWIDDVAGLPARYTSKLFAPDAVKGLGRVSLGPLLGALGLRLIVVEDPEAFARVKRRIVRKRNANETMPTKRRGWIWRKNPELARVSRNFALTKISMKKRSEIGRLGAAIRWGDVKAAVRARRKKKSHRKA